MRKFLLILVAVFVSLTGFSQKQDASEIELFNSALNFYNAGKIDTAIIIWTDFVNNKKGIHFDTYGSAFLDIPTAYWQLKKYDKAKEWYKKVLSSDLHDYVETGDIMEPHANYKHKAAVALAGLYQIDSSYNDVLYWLNQADTVYRYWGFEGSADNVSEKEEYLLEWKVDILTKLKRKEEAVQQIISELIYSASVEGYFKKSEDVLFTLIDKDNFKKELDISLNNLTIRFIDSTKWMANFNFLGLQYNIPIANAYPENLPHYWKIWFVNKNQLIDKNYIIDYIKKRNFYQRLIN